MAADLAGVLVILVPVDTISAKVFRPPIAQLGVVGPKKTSFDFLTWFGT